MTVMRLLLGFIAYRPWLYAANALAWTLIYLAPIVPGIVTKLFFDTLTNQSAYQIGVWAIVGLLFGAALARSVLIVFGFLTDVHFRFRMTGLLRRNLISHILKQPGARAIPVSPGEAISTFRDDVEQVEEAISWSVDTFGLTCFAIVSGYILVQIDATMTIWVFCPLVAVVTLAQVSTAMLQKYRAASREATSQVTGVISEMFGSVQAIQVAGAEKRMIDQFMKLNDHRRKAVLKDKVFSQVLDSVFSNAVNIGTGLILLFAAKRIQSGSFTVGDFALFVYYLTFVTTFIQNFGKFLTYYKQSVVSKDRLVGLLQGASAERLIEPHPLFLTGDLPEAGEIGGSNALTGKGRSAADEREETKRSKAHSAAYECEKTKSSKAQSAAGVPLLVAEGVSFRYSGSGRGVEDVNLSLERGSFTVITGRIGAGKTTLVRALIGLLPLTGGKIHWNGEEVTSPGDFFVPPRSAYTPQVPQLYSDTLRNNILLGVAEEDGRLETAVHAAVLERDVEHLSQGLDTVIGPRGVKLSGGQAQRTAAARMLVRDAELLVFDDISSALDVETEERLWHRLFQRKDATCLVVSHRKPALQRADRIIVLKDGRIDDIGTLTELLERNEELQHLWHGDRGE
jgi:ATP-binding cassette, subfamily B, bacterial